MYYKIVDGQKIFDECITILLGDCWVSNPTPEMIAEAGWTLYEPEPYVPTFEELIENKVNESNEYAESLKHVSFFGNDIWLNPTERMNYRTTLEAAQALGETSITFKGLTVPIDQAIMWLNYADVWAFHLTIVKDNHETAIRALTTEEELEDYDFTIGYPEPLIIGPGGSNLDSSTEITE
jgi:hypothetical protein